MNSKTLTDVFPQRRLTLDSLWNIVHFHIRGTVVIKVSLWWPPEERWAPRPQYAVWWAAIALKWTMIHWGYIWVYDTWPEKELSVISSSFFDNLLHAPWQNAFMHSSFYTCNKCSPTTSRLKYSRVGVSISPFAGTELLQVLPKRSEQQLCENIHHQAIYFQFLLKT